MHPLPANAKRIRYLESTGTQYIDTGILVSNTDDAYFSVDCTITNEDLSESSFAGSGVASIGGLHYVAEKANNGNVGIRTGGGNLNNRISYTLGSRVRIETYYDSEHCRNVAINGQKYVGTSYNATTAELQLLKMAGAGTINLQKGNLYSATVKIGSTLVRDFIPCRIGQTGYLFDRVTGELYGNAGTGDFVLGPDIDYAGVLPTRMMAMGALWRPYDAEVEYVESTGSQYVDTGIAVSLVKAVAFDFEFTPSSMSATGFIGSAARSGSSNAQKERFYGNATTSGGAVSNGYVDCGDVSEPRVTLTAISSGARSVLQKHAINIASTTATDGANAFLFCASTNNGGAPSSKASVRLYSCALWGAGDAMLRDFIPVRVGSGTNAIGYLYDRVSGTLFGNAGTGSFVVGPDK